MLYWSIIKIKNGEVNFDQNGDHVPLNERFIYFWSFLWQIPFLVNWQEQTRKQRSTQESYGRVPGVLMMNISSQHQGTKRSNTWYLFIFFFMGKRCRRRIYFRVVLERECFYNYISFGTVYMTEVVALLQLYYWFLATKRFYFVYWCFTMYVPLIIKLELCYTPADHCVAELQSVWGWWPSAGRLCDTPWLGHCHWCLQSPPDWQQVRSSSEVNTLIKFCTFVFDFGIGIAVG